MQEHLAAKHRCVLATKLARVLRQSFRDASEEPLEEIVPQVDAQIQNASRYGRTSEFDACVYALTAWVTGAEFDSLYPAAHEVLTSTMTPEEKSKWLYEWLQAMIHTLGQPS